MEMTWLAHLGAPLSQSPGAPVSKAVPVNEAVRAIREIGAEHFLITSDLGQANNPFPVDSFRKICTRLLESGMSERDVRMLVADNPARLLGVDG